MIHIEVFETNSEYNVYTSNNTRLDSGTLYYIKEDNTAHIYTNNIDGTIKIFNFSSDEPSHQVILNDQELGWSNSTVTVTETGTYEGTNLINVYNLPVTYSSSNTNVATINSSGQVNVVADGTATITAAFAGNENYFAKSVTYELTANIPEVIPNSEFKWSANSVSATEAGTLSSAPTLTNTHNVPVTYSSSNTNVATIDNSGQVNVVADGTATITAAFAGNADYVAKSASYTLNVHIPQVLTDAEFSWPIQSINIDENGGEVILTNTHNLPVTYTCSDESVVIYDSEIMLGQLLPVNDGDATITASFAGNADYVAKSVQFSVSVDVQYDVDSNDFKWSALSAKATQAGSFVGPTLTNTNNLPVTYSSSDTNVATVNASGQVTVIANGSANITASFVGDNYYNAKTATYSLLVKIPQNLANNEFAWTSNSATATATGSFSDNSLVNTHNLPVTYTSSNQSVATINASGQVNVVADGTATITAAFAGNEDYIAKSVAYSLTVQIPVELTDQEFALDDSEGSIRIAGSGSDVFTPSLTNTHNLPVTYTSSDESVATVDSNGQVTATGTAGTTTITISFAGNADYVAKSVSYTLYVYVPEELPANEFAWSANSATATQSGSFSGPTLTNTNNVSVTYSSSDTSVATVDEYSGVITVIANGSTTITATFDGDNDYLAKEISYTLTVAIPQELPANAFKWSSNSASVTTDDPFYGPSLTNTNNLPVTYSSSNTNVATIDEYGDINILANGSTTISAIFAGNSQYNSKTVSYTLTVAIPQVLSDLEFSITDTDGDITVAESNTYTNLPSLINTHNLPVTYSSSNQSVATVNASGQITPLATGTTTITITFAGNGDYVAKSVSYNLDVVKPETLTDTELSWSANSASATAAGSLSSAPTLTNTHNLSVTYSSSDTNVATVNNSGQVTVVANGTATISAIFVGSTYYKAKTVTYTLTVAIPQELPANAFKWSKLTATATATGTYNEVTLINTYNLPVTYSASDTGVATVDSNGQVTVVANGYTGISASFAGNSSYAAKSVTYMLTVSIPQVLTDQEFGLSANTGTATGLSTMEVPTLTNTHNLPVTYSSSNQNVATINSNGELTIVANGSTTITISFAGNSSYVAKSVSYTLTVAIPQTLTDAEFAWSASTGQITEASILEVPTLINTHNLPVTYESSNQSIAIIDANGNITGASTGTCTITASFEGNSSYVAKSVTYTLSVSMQQTLSNEEFAWSDSTGTATGTSGMGLPTLINEIGVEVTYSSSNQNIATIDASGAVTPIANGITTITASFAGNSSYFAKSVSYILTVAIPRELPANEFAWSSNIAQATSAGVYSGPTLTNTNNLPVTYSSNNQLVATIDSSRGEVIVHGAGQATISAIFAGNSTYTAKTVTYTLTVTLAQTLTDAEFSWSANSASATAVGSLSSAPTLTNTHGLSVTYSSSNTNVATIEPTYGHVIVSGNGSTTITATFAGNSQYNAKTVSYTLTVAIPATLTDAEFGWSNGGANVSVYQNTGYQVTSPTLNNTHGLTVRFESSDLNVARFNNNTMPPVITGDGTTTIRAIFVGNSTYAAKTVTYTLYSDTSAHIITSSSNAALMSLMSSSSLAANSTFMTQNEAAAVTQAQFNNTYFGNANIITFNELQYFTGITQITAGNFTNNRAMQQITIPANVTSIATGAFANCVGLRAISVDSNSSYYSALDGVLYDAAGTTLIHYPQNKQDTSFEIPAGVTTIENTFMNGNLYSVTIPSTVTSIANGAFYNIGASNMFFEVYVNIDTPLVIGSNCFYYRGDYGYLYVPYGSLADYQATNVWNEFLNIQEMEPEGWPSERAVDMISNAPAMTAINNNNSISHDSQDYLTIEEAEAVTDNEFTGTFSNNTDLTDFSEYQFFTGLENINSHTVSGNSVGEFEGCTNLKFINIPEGITTIGTNAFKDCGNGEGDSMNIDFTMIYEAEYNNSGNYDLRQITYLGQFAFDNSGISDLNWLQNMTGINVIPQYCFANLAWMASDTELIIPNNVQRIDDNAFEAAQYYDEGLEDYVYNGWLSRIDIGTGILRLGNYGYPVFTGQINLSQIIIRTTTPPHIYSTEFADCPNGFKIYVPYSAVNTYKNNSEWSRLSSNIYSIEADLADDDLAAGRS